MKGACTIKQQPILQISLLDINAVFARLIMFNNVCQLWLKKWKKNVDNGGVFGALLTDLPLKLLSVFRMIALLQNQRHMVFTQTSSNLFKAICQIESKELNLMRRIAHERIYFMVSHRDPYSVLHYSIYIYVSYSIFQKIQTLQAMRMILQFIWQAKKKSQLLVHQKHFHHCSLYGLIRTS